MSNHTAAMLLAPAKPKPVQSFHALGLHYHFTAATAPLALLAVCALLVCLYFVATGAATRRANRRRNRRAQAQ